MTTIDPRLLTDAELQNEISAIDATVNPMYAQLEKMGDDAFLPRSWKYTPQAQSIANYILPFAERRKLIEFEQKRRAQDAANKRAWDAKAKRIADAEVFQRRNGWEIVKDYAQYVLRHPETKEEVYTGRLTRVRQVADESKPDMQCGCDESVGFWCAKHAEERSIFLRHPQLKGTTF